MDLYWRRHGSALYLDLLRANFLSTCAESPSAKESFVSTLRSAVKSVPTDTLKAWINDSWRMRLTASWLVGLRRESRLRPEVRVRFLASETCFAGQGLCFAVARFEDKDAASTLISYLNAYLPVGERDYDQLWAIGALTWLDARLGTQEAQAFTDEALWEVHSGGRTIARKDPSLGIAKFARVMSFVDEFEGG